MLSNKPGSDIAIPRDRAAKLLVALVFFAFALHPRPARAQQEGAVLDNTVDVHMNEADLGEARPTQSRFHDSTFVWFNSIGAMGLVKNSELTWNPVYAWLFRAYPRFYLTDKLSLRVKAGIGIEWTNADDTNQYHETRWEDLWFDVVYSPLFRDSWSEVEVTPSMRFVAPTSKESRADSLYVALGPGLTFRRTFSLPWNMGLNVGYTFRFTKNLNEYTTTQYESPTILGCGAIADLNGAACDSLLHSGVRVVSYQFFNNLLLELEMSSKWRLSTMVAFIHSRLYDLTTARISLAGGETVVVGPDSQNDVNYRMSMWYLLELEYQLHPVISVSAGLSTLSPQLAQDSTRQAPFINRYTEFVISTTIALDQAGSRMRRIVSSHSNN